MYPEIEGELKKPLKYMLFPALVIAVVIISLMSLVIISFTMPFTADFENRDLYGITEINGYSMYPTMHEGDHALIMDTSHPDFNVSEGDIIIYQAEITEDGREMNIYVAHRIIDMYASGETVYCVPKGDNNEYADDPVPLDSIDAKVVEVIEGNIEHWSFRLWQHAFSY